MKIQNQNYQYNLTFWIPTQHESKLKTQALRELCPNNMMGDERR